MLPLTLENYAKQQDIHLSPAFLKWTAQYKHCPKIINSKINYKNLYHKIIFVRNDTTLLTCNASLDAADLVL